MSINKSWDLTPLFKSDDDPAMARHRKRAERQVSALVNKWRKRDDYLTEVSALVELLTDYESWLDGEAAFAQEWYYFDCRGSQDQTNDKIKARSTQVTQAGQKLINQTRFILHNLGTKVTPKNQRLFLRSPKLKPYRNFLKSRFDNGKHQLSIETENALALKEQPAHQEWIDLTQRQVYQTTAKLKDDTGKSKERPFSEISGMLQSRKATVRDSAAKVIDQTADTNADIATAELNAILLNKQIDDDLRHFDQPNSARLVSDQLADKTITGLLKAVADSNKIAHNFYALKAKVMGKTKIGYHERTFNPFAAPNVKYSFARAVDLTGRTFSHLDPQFGTIFTGLVQNGQIDALPKKGKHGNAYCNAGLRRHPIYILLNHTDNIRDVRTLAHEAGHAVNFTLIKNQNALNFGVSLALAETASTFFEDFIIEEILRTQSSPAMRKYLLFEKISDAISSIHRQIALYQFELALHRKFREQGRLSKEDINDLFGKHMASYMGPAVDQPASSRLWWVHWPHIRNFFYVYSYASGCLVSKILQQKLAADPSYIQKIKWLFSVGESQTPADALKKIGIDINLSATWQIGLTALENDLKLLTEEATKVS